MKFAEDDLSEGYFITAYDSNSVQVNGKNFGAALVITQDTLIDDWAPASVQSLCAEHFDIILELKPELILLGTGNALTFPDVSLYAAVIQRGIGIEIMDTGAACRTYNILTSEGRRVVAGLII